MEHMTSTDLAAIAGLEDGVGLIFCGAIEQHGPHLPIATDTLIARHLRTEVANRLEGPVVLAPTFPLGVSAHHLGFPGTVHLAEGTFKACVGALADALDRLGVRRIAVLSAHAGNFAALEALEPELDARLDARVACYHHMDAYMSVMRDAALDAGLDVSASDTHAGGLETSQMLYLWGGDRVGDYELVEGYTAAEPGWLDTLLAHGVEAVSPSGVLGRPGGASGAVGARICRALADHLAAWVEARLSYVPTASQAERHGGSSA